jgi:hypothetical protein
MLGVAGPRSGLWPGSDRDERRKDVIQLRREAEADFDHALNALAAELERHPVIGPGVGAPLRAHRRET